jgi:hypothetical protein
MRCEPLLLRLPKTAACCLWGREDEAFSHFCVEEHPGSSRVDVKDRWHRWIYATNESLLPFMILIIFGLAANVFSVFDMTRDAMTSRCCSRATRHRETSEASGESANRVLVR